MVASGFSWGSISRIRAFLRLQTRTRLTTLHMTRVKAIRENIYHCVNFSPVLAFPAMQGYVTTTEAAERLGLSSARVRQLVASGTLPAQKFGPVNMVKESDLELVRNRPGVGRPPKAAKGGGGK